MKTYHIDENHDIVSLFQAELEEANQKEGPEVTEAENTVADVEKLFETKQG